MAKTDVCIMLVTNDKLQLPLASADSISELEKQTGISHKVLSKAIRSGRPVRLPRRKYSADSGLVIRVNLEEED